jgi:hypothetical protein
MRIEADSVLRHPLDAVFAAYRDDLTAFVEYLPNVRHIEIIARADDGDVVRLHNRWHGATELPQALASRLEARFLSWDDYAVWDARTHVCEWTIHPLALREAVRCRGQNVFVELGGERTRLEIRGELSIELERVPAVPAFLAGSLARTAESFLVRQIAANLASMSDALAAYLGKDTVT